MALPGPVPPRASRAAIVAALLGHDVFMAGLAMEGALALRHRLSGLDQPLFDQWEATLLFMVVAAGVFFGAGLHRGVWRYTALTNLLTIVKAVTLAILVFLPSLFLLTRLELFPRSVLLIVWPLLIVLLALPRFGFRLWSSGSFASLLSRDDPSRVPVLVAGLSAEADRFIREAAIDRASPFRVVGLMDADPQNSGRDLRGVRVLGAPNDIERIVERLTVEGRRPQKIVLSPHALEGGEVRALFDTADRLGISLARLSRATELATTASGQAELKPIDVSDLLGRPQKRLDRAAMRALVAGRHVLVTGAGGTIGSELCRQIAPLEPRLITLLDHGEFALYQIDLELKESEPRVVHRAVLADVRQRDTILRLIGEAKPDIVFHAAALKHVPLVEDNPAEGVLTNIEGTRNVADACRAHGVRTMVLISTDKAVHPTSVMGATKRVAELYCQALQDTRPSTRFVTVRFGNVLGSTGSVVPLFQHQLARGGPLTVTHPEVSRYFMTTREAVELVLEAAALPAEAEGGTAPIFVLDMGEPVLIADLARQMIRLAGLRPDIDIDIVFTGLRPGEKLHERLFHEGEPLVATAAEGILLARPRVEALASLMPKLERLISAARSRDSETVRQLLTVVVPEFASGSLDGLVALRHARTN